MPLADFVHLRAFAYSLSEGAIKIKELVELAAARRCRRSRHRHRQSVRRDGVRDACTDSGMQPIIGCEIALAPGSANGNGNGETAESSDQPTRSMAASPTGSCSWCRTRPATAI